MIPFILAQTNVDEYYSERDKKSVRNANDYIRRTSKKVEKESDNEDQDCDSMKCQGNL